MAYHLKSFGGYCKHNNTTDPVGLGGREWLGMIFSYEDHSTLNNKVPISKPCPAVKKPRLSPQDSSEECVELSVGMQNYLL